MASIYLIRHAQAPWGEADYDRLTALGRRQAEVLGAALRQRLAPPCRVMHGDMLRHRLTAQIALLAMELTLPAEAEPGFREYDHLDVVDRYMDRRALAALPGDAATRRREFERRFVTVMARWQSGEHDADYDETWTAFRDRGRSALERLAATLSGREVALVFTSGGVISALVQGLMRLAETEFAALNWRLVNAGITKLICGPGGVQVSTLNEHAHFESPHATDLLTYR